MDEAVLMWGTHIENAISAAGANIKDAGMRQRSKDSALKALLQEPDAPVAKGTYRDPAELVKS